MTKVLKLYIDGKPTSLTPAPRLKNGDALVPIHAFSKVVGAVVKDLEDSGKLAVCKDDLCIPIDDNANIVSIEGIVYVPLSAFADALGLSWKIENDILLVTSSTVEHTGLGIGDRPPDFTLPDIYTGELVSLRDYRGKKAVFFMWASW